MYRDTTLIDSFDLINEEWPNLFVFEELTATNLYTINVTFSYDLNDGIGIQSQTVTKSIRTMALPISITNVVVLNSTLPKVGEEVTIRVSLNNPSKVTLSSLTVNNTLVKITGGDLINFAILSFVPNTQGGVYEVSIDGLSYTQSSDVFTQSIPTPYLKEIKVLGSVVVERIYNDNENIIAQDTTDNYFVIDLKNPTGYSITALSLRNNWSSEIVYSADEIEMINNNRIRIPHKGSSYYFSLSNQNISLTKLTYGLDDIGYSEIEVNDVSNEFMFFKTLTARSIGTIDELKNIENGYIYELTNDLDFSEVSWNNQKTFYGMIDGKGYKMTNFSQVIVTQATESLSVGLFKEFQGKIKNLILDNFYFYINSKGSVSVSALSNSSGNFDNIVFKNASFEVDAPSASIAGLTQYGNIYNSVIENISISLNSPNGVGGAQVSGGNRVSGVYNGGSLVNSLVQNIDITVTAKSVGIGGVGQSGNINQSIVNDVTIKYTETRPTQEANPWGYEMNIGGLLGSIGTVENSIASNIQIDAIRIYNSLRLGGIGGIYGKVDKVLFFNINLNSNSGGGGVGYLYSSTIQNSLAINISNARGSIYGSSAGTSNYAYSINNYVSFDSPVQNNTNFIATLEQLNSSDFYITTLGWDNAIWNFDNLNYANGIYPTLINIPQQQ